MIDKYVQIIWQSYSYRMTHIETLIQLHTPASEFFIPYRLTVPIRLSKTIPYYCKHRYPS